VNEVIREREVNVLEFDKIRESLAALTVSPMAANMAETLLPSADFNQVQRWQKETAEGRMLCNKNAFSPSGVEDIELVVTRSEKGAILSGQELAEVKSFIQAVKRWVKFFKDNEKVIEYPLLAEMVELLHPCHELYAELDRSIDQEGAVLDSASATLTSIRRRKISLQSKIRDKLEDYIRGTHTRKYLQEALVTIRGGRYVLPVKQEYRQNIDGVVHDQSSSGATLFIEPLPVVQMQNELTGFYRQEEQEIERILYQLSGQVADNGSALLQNRSLYAELDFIVARGRYSLSVNGNEPEITKSTRVTKVNLENATHPLLPGKKVPLKFSLGDPIRTLVVTGPNTGGKTVALKTIGLLAVMAQCGLQLPAERGTRVAVFGTIRADIGDEQSIAQSLSTFSGHMNNIIGIIEETGPESLVLFDELGAGTDPSEGSALAMAILEELTARGALTVATTHINELKLFAQVREQMQNAAMEFDPDTLTPTYRLLQGVPGQSNAFYITGQLGLPEDILQKARSFLHRSHDQVEAVIASLVEDQQRYHRDSHQAAMERSRAEVVMADLENERELLKARRDDILKEAREEARLLVKKVKNDTDRLIKEMKAVKSGSVENPATKAEEIRHDLNQLKQELNFTENEVDESETVCAGELETGELVYVRSLRQNGTIITVMENEALLQVGSMKVHLPLHELIKVKKSNAANKMAQKESGGYSVTKDLSISNSVDLRGLNFDQAQPLVDKLLDNALWAGLNSVDLIHGKGTGKLKQALRGYLKEHPLVKSMRSGNPAEGGEGVTVVTLKT
jgi:DNA mismatch repair protein MutS2